MDNKYDEQFIITQDTIEANKQEMRSNKKDSDEKITRFTVKSETMIAVISNQLNTLVSSQTQKDTSNPQEPTTVVPDTKRDPPLDGGNFTKIGGMWTLKYEIISPKFYELLIKTELKEGTSLDLKKFYSNIKMCLNVVTRIQ